MGSEIPSAPVSRRPGRPAFKATAALRQSVELHAAAGMTEAAIGQAIGCGRTTLRHHFAEELATGRAKRPAENLIQIERAAKAGRVAAMVYLDRLMTRSAKREANKRTKSENPARRS